MRKLLLMISLFISISFIFIGCSKNEEKQCKDVTKNFTIEMYNHSCDELEKLYLSLDANDIEEIEKSIAKILSYFDKFKKYFTDKGFNKAMNNRMFTYHDNYLIDNKKNITFFDIKFNDFSKSKSALDNKDYMHVKYTVYFNLTNKDGTIYKEFEDNLYVILTTIDGEWKINYFRMTPFKALDNR